MKQNFYQDYFITLCKNIAKANKHIIPIFLNEDRKEIRNKKC